MRRPSQRGTASVEVVVMLPVFIILVAAIYHVHGVAMARLEARAAARGCAYQYAMDACQPAEHLVDLCTVAEPARGGAPLDGGDSAAQAGGIFAELERWPVLGPAVISVFGETASASATSEGRAHLAAEPDAGVATESIYLVCNTEPRDWGGIASHVCELGRLALGEELPGC
jgi:hypothetical protein